MVSLSLSLLVSFAVLFQLTVTGLCVENNVNRSISLAFKRGGHGTIKPDDRKTLRQF